MKVRLYCAAVGLMLFSLGAGALELVPDGMTAGYGKYIKSKANINNIRGSIRWDWNQPLIKKSGWELRGYTDLGFSSWKSDHSVADQPGDGADSAWQIGLSPVFRINFMPDKNIAPFIDFGVGGSYQSEKDLQKKLKSPINMSHLSFEIRAMAGVRFGREERFELNFGWFHYSNAGLHSINEPLDFYLLMLAYQW